MIYPPHQKPPLWSIDPGIVAYNCHMAGMPYPVLAMPMWEGAGGLARDYSGHGIHGTLVNGQNWASDGIDLDGYNDYITCGDNPNLEFAANQPFGFSALINADTANEIGSIINKRYVNVGTASQYRLRMNTDRTLVFNIHDGNPYECVTTTALTLGITYHIFAQRLTNGTIEIYLDGVLEGSNGGTAAAMGVNDGQFLIGCDSREVGKADPITDWLRFDGIINNPIVFSAEHTAAQIKFLSDNQYFMYQLPEELYGYVAGAPPTGNPFWYYEMLRKRNK